MHNVAFRSKRQNFDEHTFKSSLTIYHRDDRCRSLSKLLVTLGLLAEELRAGRTVSTRNLTTTSVADFPCNVGGCRRIATHSNNAPPTDLWRHSWHKRSADQSVGRPFNSPSCQGQFFQYRTPWTVLGSGAHLDIGRSSIADHVFSAHKQRLAKRINSVNSGREIYRETVFGTEEAAASVYSIAARLSKLCVGLRPTRAESIGAPDGTDEYRETGENGEANNALTIGVALSTGRPSSADY